MERSLFFRATEEAGERSYKIIIPLIPTCLLLKIPIADISLVSSYQLLLLLLDVRSFAGSRSVPKQKITNYSPENNVTGRRDRFYPGHVSYTFMALHLIVKLVF